MEPSPTILKVLELFFSEDPSKRPPGFVTFDEFAKPTFDVLKRIVDAHAESMTQEERDGARSTIERLEHVIAITSRLERTLPSIMQVREDRDEANAMSRSYFAVLSACVDRMGGAVTVRREEALRLVPLYAMTGTANGAGDDEIVAIYRKSSMTEDEAQAWLQNELKAQTV
jgi:hypothetical protein